MGDQSAPWDGASTTQVSSGPIKLLPYPQQVTAGDGELRLGAAKFQTGFQQSSVANMAMTSLRNYLPGAGKNIRVRLGSVEDGYNKSWLSADDNRFLAAAGTSDEASILTVDDHGITVVGKAKAGMLYGVQTVNQLIRQARAEDRDSIPHLSIRDWPDMRWRCLAPTLTWYSGWNRLEGYDICNWSEGEWKWLADWSLLHKCNAWAVCMYGYWPFALPEHVDETLSVESDYFNPQTRAKEAIRN